MGIKPRKRKALTLEPPSVEGCEWDPAGNRPAVTGDDHNSRVGATLCVGARGDWHLCAGCASLPQFKRFRARKELRHCGN